jgi:hypothetical protein
LRHANHEKQQTRPIEPAPRRAKLEGRGGAVKDQGRHVRDGPPPDGRGSEDDHTSHGLPSRDRLQIRRRKPPIGRFPQAGVPATRSALERINALLSDENIKSVSDSLANAKRASQELPAAVAEARAMFSDLKDAANEMETTMSALGELGGADIKASATRLREVADTIAVTASRIDRLVAENQGNVDRFAGQGLAEFEQLMREARAAMRSVEALTKSLEQDPSRVIYGPAPSGVEIPP